MSLTDAETGLLALYAEDAYQTASAAHDGAASAVEPDTRIPTDLEVVESLTARDAVFAKGPMQLGETVWYSWLLRSRADPGEFILAIRGTMSMLEWLDDAKGCPTTGPHGTRVELGFWEIYRSLAIAGAKEGTAADDIARIVGKGRITVVGHSLGAAVATYAAYDLAADLRLGGRVAARIFASPRPGDRAFGRLAVEGIQDVRSWRYELDVVPWLPWLPGYDNLPGTVRIPRDQTEHVGLSLMCSHHQLTYSTLLQLALRQSFRPLLQDRPYLGCLGIPYVGPTDSNA